MPFQAACLFWPVKTFFQLDLNTMPYLHILVQAPLPPLTYFHSEALPRGTRVAVPFRRRTVAGIVWGSVDAPEIDAAKILAVESVLDGARLSPDWCALVDFAARYYHYPLGQTAFAALPPPLKEPQAAVLPAAEPVFALSAVGRMQPPPPERHVKQRALWTALAEGGAQRLGSLKVVHGQAAKQLAQWQAQGWVEAVTEEAVIQLPPPSRPLNPLQQAALAAVQAAWGQFCPLLLHGVTGSGKTEVYFEAAADALNAGKQVLFLLPEINLTPQLLRRIEARFPGLPLAVLHSQTTAAQRNRDYLRALSGEARLVVGTRLAVFTPLPHLGLVVVDEEHDASFKQDNDLRYHARDLAVWRAQQADCPVLLGSATPSLESWHKAKSGAYRLLRLPERANPAAVLPEIRILDVRRLPLDNGMAAEVVAALQRNRAQGGLSLVYLNRRGFAPALFCSACGHTFGCPHCSAKTVLHQRARQLRCHHCGFRQPVPHHCPDCGNQDLTAVGHGTQRVEEALRHALPDAAVLRVDRDSTARKSDWDELYAQIDGGRADVLVGTQMLAKGHDFARLNLVAVINADGSLFSADFRAPERLFAELMQVSGRAGRAEHPGRVIIQTQLPDHPVFAAVRRQDYAAFADAELAARQTFGLPPFGFQAAIRADAAKMADALAFLDTLRDRVAAELPSSVSQLGAVPMLMARLAERERAQLFLESPDRRDLHRALSHWTAALAATRDHSVRWSVDVDPQEM